ncbi:MAG: formylglycine-generating enzyme family protein [Spirulina sp. SIO3F2]|nr:formylglycine-generating enzyme family protein [Spirulina sp. SIO3F2]
MPPLTRRQLLSLSGSTLGTLLAMGQQRPSWSLSIHRPSNLTVETIHLGTQGQVLRRSQHYPYRHIEHLSPDVALELIEIPGGRFVMGSAFSEQEQPMHSVRLQPFAIGRFPITQAQWKAVVEQTKMVALPLAPEPAYFQTDFSEPYSRWQRPIENVNWYEALEFCARLSQLTGQQYRLPSEAEWEYACRAHTETHYHFGDGINTKVANYRGTAQWQHSAPGLARGQTTPVGYFQVANAFGLSDMHGNVFEWCADPWHETYEDAPNRGQVWDAKQPHIYADVRRNIAALQATEPIKVIRGGSWFYEPQLCRSAYRVRWYADARTGDQGFRVCRSR